MSTASSAFSARRRIRPYIPLIQCPDCGSVVVQSRSTTEKHDGWVYYKCKTHSHGCVFWHWELEYITYLIEHHILHGDAAVEAYGWAEERREALNLRQEEMAATKRGRDEVQMKNCSEVVVVPKEVVLMLKIVAALLGLTVLVLIMKK